MERKLWGWCCALLGFSPRATCRMRHHFHATIKLDRPCRYAKVSRWLSWQQRQVRWLWQRVQRALIRGRGDVFIESHFEWFSFKQRSLLVLCGRLDTTKSLIKGRGMYLSNVTFSDFPFKQRSLLVLCCCVAPQGFPQTSCDCFL